MVQVMIQRELKGYEARQLVLPVARKKSSSTSRRDSYESRRTELGVGNGGGVGDYNATTMANVRGVTAGLWSGLVGLMTATLQDMLALKACLLAREGKETVGNLLFTDCG